MDGLFCPSWKKVRNFFKNSDQTSQPSEMRSQSIFKGQIKPKADCGAVDSPKKQFFFLPWKAKNTSSFVHFLGQSTVLSDL